ncbi:MAG: SNF2-related protein, partial [Acidimicrobiia bacterium]
DLVGSGDPLVVAGFSSISRFVDLAHDWATRQSTGTLRFLIGSEPFDTERTSFAAPEVQFTEEVWRYWTEEHGVSIRQSARIIEVIALLDAGRIDARFLLAHARLHAKIYVGADAATVGSSNFTRGGLVDQFEANARFTSADERQRYDDLCTIARNYWDEGTDWNAELRRLLEALLRVVSWQEALARACAELLDGQWAARYLQVAADSQRLWPSQLMGIAQALWIIENVGSVLVADATGSGKTRMGAHMVRAVRDRLWASGRTRRDLTALVCPPGVRDTWVNEALKCGVGIHAVSHGLLSRDRGDGEIAHAEAIRDAEILAVDEVHNFLSRTATRAQRIREATADHVLMFTATPINREAADLLRLVGLLGAENFDDDTLDVLDRLERRGSVAQATGPELDTLRQAIQRFTVRRTKRQLNELVEREPDAYRDPVSGKVCRYPGHQAEIYETGETPHDESVAAEVRRLVGELTGVARLEREIAVPAALRKDYTDEQWLATRLRSSKALAGHTVLNAMRSSRAALLEHLVGTGAAASEVGLDPSFKAQASGDAIGRLDELASSSAPTVKLACDLPPWLVDDDEWRRCCEAERATYERILELARSLSNARERTKADTLVRLAQFHERVLAFDRHPITLHVIKPMLDGSGADVMIATGGDDNLRKRLTRAFAPTATARAIALCSDAMNEGLNLQGASAVVHLDLPTTLRVAEQRVGRVDRMNSPHDEIDVFWPKDGHQFATRANERLMERAEESARLLGSNLEIPAGLAPAGALDAIVEVEQQIDEVASNDGELWDGMRDAFEPVRDLVTGERSLVPAAVYETLRGRSERVVARVSPVRSDTPWGFFAVAGSQHGAPRWFFVEQARKEVLVDLQRIAERLRHHLGPNPPGRDFDDAAERWLQTFLAQADAAERLALPRRMQRALAQMEAMCAGWARACDRTGDTAEA